MFVAAAHRLEQFVGLKHPQVGLALSPGYKPEPIYGGHGAQWNVQRLPAASVV